MGKHQKIPTLFFKNDHITISVVWFQASNLFQKSFDP